MSEYVYIANEEIYKGLWKKSPVEIYKTPGFDTEYKVLDRIDMISGLQAVLIQETNDKSKGSAIIVFQGSFPGITDRKLVPINWDKDWSNNMENVSTLTRGISVLSSLIGGTLNVVGKGAREAGNTISNNSVIKTSEYGEVPFAFEGLFIHMNNIGNYTVLPTSEIGKKLYQWVIRSGIKVRGYEPTNRNPNAIVYPKENQ